MKVAIVGSGISGLAAASRICKAAEVTVFETAHYIGGHTNTVDVWSGGRSWAVDTGFIVYNDRTYPNLVRLFSDLGIRTRPAPMTFSVSCQQSGLEYRGADLGGLFAWKRNLFNWRFHGLLRDIVRFNRQAVTELDSMDEQETVASWFERNRYSEAFYRYWFLPLGSSIWSCPRRRFESFPIRFIVQFYERHGLLSFRDRPQWRVVCNGSREYLGPLTRPFADRIRLNCPVQAIRRTADHVELVCGILQETLRFDHVVFACHADQALQILGPAATPTERAVLSAFPYQQNQAVLHTDESVLPRRKRAWAAWNYHLPAGDSDQATLTYNMNILQSLPARETFCVTLNSDQRIDPARIVRRFRYSHPVFDRRRTSMQQRFAELQATNRTSFCGAYWGNGFHEDGITSGLEAARHLLERTSHEQLSLRGTGAAPAV